MRTAADKNDAEVKRFCCSAENSDLSFQRVQQIMSPTKALILEIAVTFNSVPFLHVTKWSRTYVSIVKSKARNKNFF